MNGLSISQFFGSEIIITKHITKTVQARCHKKRRINKKWLKRYGYKSVPDDNKMLVVGNRIFMTQRAFDRINKVIKGEQR